MQTKCGFEPLMHIVEPRIPNVHTFSLSLCAEFCLHTCSNLIFLFFLIIKLTCDLSDAKWWKIMMLRYALLHLSDYFGLSDFYS